MAETSLPSPGGRGTVCVSWIGNLKYAGSSPLAAAGQVRLRLALERHVRRQRHAARRAGGVRCRGGGRVPRRTPAAPGARLQQHRHPELVAAMRPPARSWPPRASGCRSYWKRAPPQAGRRCAAWHPAAPRPETSTAPGGVSLPTFVPFKGQTQPDLPGSASGLDPAVLQIPIAADADVPQPPGDGSDVSAIVGLTYSPPPGRAERRLAGRQQAARGQFEATDGAKCGLRAPP